MDGEPELDNLYTLLSDVQRKAEDEEVKETRLQGLKAQLAAADEDTEALQQEIEDLEARIDELTSFESDQMFQANGEL